MCCQLLGGESRLRPEHIHPDQPELKYLFCLSRQRRNVKNLLYAILAFSSQKRSSAKLELPVCPVYTSCSRIKLRWGKQVSILKSLYYHLNLCRMVFYMLPSSVGGWGVLFQYQPAFLEKHRNNLLSEAKTEAVKMLFSCADKRLKYSRKSIVHWISLFCKPQTSSCMILMPRCFYYQTHERELYSVQKDYSYYFQCTRRKSLGELLCAINWYEKHLSNDRNLEYFERERVHL